MNTVLNKEKGITRLKIEDGLKLLRGIIIPILQRNEYLIFEREEMIFIPMEMFPDEVFTAMKSKVTKIQQKIKTHIVSNNSQEEITKIKIVTSDEDRLNELKSKGVKYRRTRGECISTEELERYQLNERIKKRKARSKNKYEQIKTISINPVEIQVNENKSIQVRSSQPCLMPLQSKQKQQVAIESGPILEIIASEINIQPNISDIDNILKKGQIVSCLKSDNINNEELSIEQPSLNEILPKNKFTNANNQQDLSYSVAEILPKSVAININNLLSDYASRRNYKVRLRLNEQLEILTWSKKRHPIDGLPFGVIIKLRTIYEKLIAPDNDNLILNIRDEELLEELSSFIHFYL